MKVSFGLHLDGQRGWRPANRLGTPIVGPLGLLNILETGLGLLRADSTHAQRVTQYRDCLKRCDTPDRFYHASFGVDPIGTTASLLSWRDAWYLHGWNGALSASAGGRLADMAAVEGLARGQVFPSIGQRLSQVAQALGQQRAGIETVELLDPLAGFPKCWREVLAGLPVLPVRTFEPSADAGTVLGKLQRALKATHEGKRPDGRIPFAGDDSVRILRAETGLVAARWLAQALEGPPNDLAMIAGQERSLLEVVLDAALVARQGFLESSRLVPALQVLPLALATIWEPLDVYALLQFLSHPMGPVRAYARRRLAEEIAEAPGIGGPRWRAVIDELKSQDPDHATALGESIAFWIEHPRYRPAEGAPVATLLEKTRAVRDYFAARCADEDPIRSRAGATGYAQADSVAGALEALAAQGESTISPRELEALVSQCTGHGAPNFALYAQVGCVPSVAEPGALIEPFDRVIWWHMGAPSLPERYPWSRREIDSLACVGVELPSLSEVLARQAQDWLRPILNARHQLILLLPPPDEETHPLWQEIQWFLAGIQPKPLEKWLTGQAGPPLPKIAPAPLPARRRWWTLAPDVKIASRPRESYSSLDAFLNAPYQWVLKYPARLRPSNLLALSDKNRLYGNLSHRLIDQYFRTLKGQPLQDDALRAWFAQAFDRVVSEEGAVLLMPGRRGDYERLRSVLSGALEELQRQFSAAGIDLVESERALVGNFPGGDLEGTADLVVRNSSGQRAIVDMKWSGSTAHRERLASNRYLQLAVYAQMLRQETGAWPQVAYFILEASRLLALDGTFFPQALAVQSSASGTTPQLWESFVSAWKWRKSQISSGTIEVAVEDIEPTLDSTAPAGALEPKDLPAIYDDYRWLTGWEG